MDFHVLVLSHVFVHQVLNIETKSKKLDKKRKKDLLVIYPIIRCVNIVVLSSLSAYRELEESEAKSRAEELERFVLPTVEDLEVEGKVFTV